MQREGLGGRSLGGGRRSLGIVGGGGGRERDGAERERERESGDRGQGWERGL